MGTELKPLPFGFAAGILWGFGVLFLGIAAATSGWGKKLVFPLGSLYVGYKPTISGSFIGGVWAMIDGFCAGFFFAWIYNYLQKMME